MNAFCTSCGHPLKPNAKFCTHCGNKRQIIPSAKKEETNATISSEKEMVSVIKNKIVWNIQPGEIARSIKEAEFVQYDSALGVIINEGTTAYIKTNGETIAEIQGGNYDFLPPQEINDILESRTPNSAQSYLRQAGKWIAALFLGKKVKDKLSKPDEGIKNIKSFDQVLEYIKRGSLFAIMLKQDREFQLIFGNIHKNIDDYANFSPMTVRTKYLDISVGVRTLFQIDDFDTFSSYYLTDNDSVRTNTLANIITPIIRNTLQKCLVDVEIKDNRIPKEVLQNVEVELKQYDFHGLVFRGLEEITAANEDLERLRALSRELYLSEQELDYLHRTNDFKNRLNAVTDAQEVYQKERELDIFKKIQEINKDKKLTEDELEKFYIVLSRENTLFKAEDESVINAALADIEKTGLLRTEELEILKHQIKERDYQRGFALELTQIKDAAIYEQTRLQANQNKEKQALAHELDQYRMKDAYEDETFRRKREQNQLLNEDKRGDVEFFRQIEEQDRQKQLDSLRQIKDIESEADDKEVERRMREKQQDIDFSLRQQQVQGHNEIETLRIKQSMSPEQLMAEKIKELTGDAAVEFSRSFSAGKDADKEKEIREEMMNLIMNMNAAERDRLQQSHESSSSDLKELMKEMMNTVAVMSGNMVQNKNEQKEEYRQQMHREQNRHDKHQDTALNYTTRQQVMPTSPQKPNQQAVEPQSVTPQMAEQKANSNKQCCYCQEMIGIEERFCDKCGREQ